MKPNNPPAFPIPAGPYIESEQDLAHTSQDGMTLRDYFAAKAMQGMIAAATANPNASEYPRPTEVARRAFRFADEMLEERAKQ